MTLHHKDRKLGFRIFHTALAITGMILKRIRFNLGLTISTEVGIVAILTLVVTVPLFTNAILSEILQEQLSEKAERNKRSLFSLHAYYLDQSNYSPVTVRGTDAVTGYIRQQFEQQMGLRVERIVVERITEQILWRPVKTRSTKPPFQYLYLNLLNNNLVPENVVFVEGEYPSMEDFVTGTSNETNDRASDPIPVAVHEQLADENFINVGDIYQSNEFPIEVVGIFRAKNPQDRAWFYSPETTFSNSLWVPIEAFETILPELLERPQNITSWYAIVRDDSLHFNHSRQYSHQMVRLDAGLKGMAPDMRIDYSPLDMLQAYEQRLRAVNILFYAAGAPMVLLALFFTSLTASIAVQQNITEIVTMRTRGMGVHHALRMNLIESLILIGIALPLVFVLSWLGAILIGQSQSFLQFAGLESYPAGSAFLPGMTVPAETTVPPYLSLGNINFAWLGLMILVILVARAAPFINLWRSPVVELKHSQIHRSAMAGKTASQAARPIWQRYYLDFLLLVPSLYIYLTYQGLLKPSTGNPVSQFLGNLKVTSGDYAAIRPDLALSYDPLIFFSAPLFAIACCMISLRLLPLALRLFHNFLNSISKPWSYLALQEISRRPHDHTSTLLLIMIALSLSIYCASMGRTLSLWLYQSRAYLSGADIVLREYELDFSSGAGAPPGSTSGSSTSSPSSPNQGNSGGIAQPGTVSTGMNSSQSETGNPLSLISLDQHLNLPEIRETTFVGEYTCTFSFAEASPSTGDKECQLLGIDRLTFPTVAFFRNGFLISNTNSHLAESPGEQSLGALMNILAAQPRSVLVPQALLDETGLIVGDMLELKASASNLGLNFDEDVKIAGAYHYFPTVYPDEKFTLVMNLDALFGSYDAIVGYNVWVDLQSGVDSTALLQQVRDLALKDGMGIRILGNSLAAIEEARSQPEWTGLFGVLNLGFLLTGLMPGIGFILYSFASLRKRTIELGILQAIGLSFRQLIGSLVLEQLLLMGIAIAGGMLIGYLSSLLFLPILQIGIGAGESVPPFQVRVGWVESGWLSLYFFIVLSITIVSTIIVMARMKIFQAVKMGESIS